MNGITVVIILLVPILFQVVYQGFRAERRHAELSERLERIEKKIAAG